MVEKLADIEAEMRDKRRVAELDPGDDGPPIVVEGLLFWPEAIEGETLQDWAARSLGDDWARMEAAGWTKARFWTFVEERVAAQNPGTSAGE